MQAHLWLKPLQENYGVTITNTVASLPSIPENALKGTIYVETANIRVKFNAGTPVAGVGGGFLFLAGTTYVIEGWDNLNKTRMIRDTGVDALLNIIYSGEI